MLFLIFHEFAAKFDIPTENPGFYGYKYGPYFKMNTPQLAAVGMVTNRLKDCCSHVKS